MLTPEDHTYHYFVSYMTEQDRSGFHAGGREITRRGPIATSADVKALNDFIGRNIGRNVAVLGFSLMRIEPVNQPAGSRS